MNVLLSDVDNIFGYIYRGFVGNQYWDDYHGPPQDERVISTIENLRESLFLFQIGVV